MISGEGDGGHVNLAVRKYTDWAYVCEIAVHTSRIDVAIICVRGSLAIPSSR